MADSSIVTVDPNEISIPDVSAPTSGMSSSIVTAAPHEIVLVPSDDPDIVKSSQRLGLARDNKPIFNVQGVDNFLRWKTQLLFDKPDEKAKYLKSVLGNAYQFDQNPLRPGDVILKRKGDAHWSVVDPGGVSGTELLKEAAENIDSFAQMAAVPADMLSGALAAGGIEAARQSVKKLLLPDASFDVPQVMANAAGGLTAGGLSQAMGAGKKVVTDATGKVLSAATDDATKGFVGKVLNFSKQPKFIAQELGANASQLNDFQRKAITENIQWLMDNSPEFASSLDKLTTRGKYEAMNEVLKDIGKKLGQFYGDPNLTVNVGDILNSKGFKSLENAVSNREVMQGETRVIVDKAVAQRADNIRKSFLEQLGSTVLDPQSDYMKLYRAGKLNSDGPLAQMGFKTNDDALIALIGNEDIPIADAWAARKGLDQKLNYNKKRGQVASVSTIQKYAADALRDPVTDAIRKTGGDEAAKLSELYHQLEPVVEITAQKAAAKDAEAFNPLKIIPGALNGMKRGGVMLARNLINRTEVRSFMRSMGDVKIPSPDGAMTDAMKQSGLQQMLRGGSFLEARQMARKQLLPRDSDAYFNDPQQINALLDQVQDPELTDAMVKQYERGDKEGFANTLSMVASSNDGAFEVAPYKSLVMQGGKPVLMDKYDREQYRQYLDKTVIDPMEKYKMLQAVNGDGTMLKAPYEPPTKALEITPRAPQGSTVSRVASKLKLQDKIVLDDGTERTDPGF